MKKKYDSKCIVAKIEQEEDICIYGAGLMAKSLFKCLSEQPFNKKIRAFIVRHADENPDNIQGVPVYELASAMDLTEKMLLVALHEKYMWEAVKELNLAGFSKIIQVSFDSDLWSDIRKMWLYANNIVNETGVVMCDAVPGNRMNLYVVHSDADKQLTENLQNRSYEISIYVGASMSEKNICGLRDDLGDNISNKNRQYCELTALYWIWKNDKSDYVGLSHYRRRFCLSDGEIESLICAKCDVIATVPVLNINTVRGQYELDHDINDWEVMLEAISKLYPEYYLVADKVQRGCYYYAYNMFITRREILNSYCEWLFALLSYCEEKIKIKQDAYQNRYPGFLAERLMTIYFIYNNYRIAVADKHFVESI